MPAIILKLSEFNHEVFDADTAVEVEVPKDGGVTHDTFSFFFENKGENKKYSFTLTKDGMDKLIHFYKQVVE
ncbi:hypothetical protein [Gorillibacterium massiliense]|uniref:hypothetical protein n=1 Tax=Gorillibacterium massiliense TaxID=1280390 RepID=UPI0004B15528|nr:hypothetical protein [Gorillibacterium massiliense]